MAADRPPPDRSYGLGNGPLTPRPTVRPAVRAAAPRVDRFAKLLPVVGDWFAVRMHDYSHRCWIDRIEAWALKRGGHIDSLAAICHGIEVASWEEADSIHFVYGPDASPFGMTWIELYQRTIPNAGLVREFTDLAAPVLAEWDRTSDERQAKAKALNKLGEERHERQLDEIRRQRRASSAGEPADE